MAVSSLTVKNVYTGNSVTKTFSYTFPIINATDIEVWVTDADGANTKLSTNYSVDTATSEVTYPVSGSALTSSEKITLIRVEPLTQEVDLKNQGPLNSEIIEAALDKLTLITQQLNESLSRAVKYPIEQTVSDATTDTFLSAIEAAKSIAESAQTAAELAEDNAHASEVAAAASQVAAAASANQAQSYYESMTSDLLVLTSTDTDFATKINALAYNDVDVLVAENIIITLAQTITKRVSWDHVRGAKIICANPVTSMIRFTAEPHIKMIDLEAQNNITNAIEFSANAIVDKSKIVQAGVGKTLTNTFLVNTGYKIIANCLSSGTITNPEGSDVDGNSEIRVA